MAFRSARDPEDGWCGAPPRPEPASPLRDLPPALLWPALASALLPPAGCEAVFFFRPPLRSDEPLRAPGRRAPGPVKDAFRFLRPLAVAPCEPEAEL